MYFLVVFAISARGRSKLTHGDFYNWGYESIVFSTGITSAVLLIYFAVTGEVYPGGSPDALRLVVGILGFASLVGGPFIAYRANKARLRRRRSRLQSET